MAYETDNQTVHFNVGGTKYEVARSTIEKHPTTMLARLISEEWQQEQKDQKTDEIFIDRDGVRFRFVLDYMRDQKAHLPLTISKAAVLQDLEYFGFNNVHPGDIDAGCATYEAASHMAMCKEHHEEEMRELELTTRHARFAFVCFEQFGQSGSHTVTVAPQVWDQAGGALLGREVERKSFNRCLAKYGLFFRELGDANYQLILTAAVVPSDPLE